VASTRPGSRLCVCNPSPSTADSVNRSTHLAQRAIGLPTATARWSHLGELGANTGTGGTFGRLPNDPTFQEVDWHRIWKGQFGMPTTKVRREKQMTAIEPFLNRLIDYAGLFPPAGLDMLTSTRNYASYRSGKYAWALGRLIVPVARLTEFSAALMEVGSDEQLTPWLLGALSTGDAQQDARLISGLDKRVAVVDVLESKAANLAEVHKLLSAVPPKTTLYVELPLKNCRQMIPALKEGNARAKIRTGGVTADAIPSVEQVAEFLAACAEAKVPFKATAGLHHPLRSVQQLTYEPGSASALMNGFINVFVAAIIAYYGATEEKVLAVLNEQDPTAFRWSRHALAWRDQELSAEQIREARENVAIGFGSCSFTEPIADLLDLGWIS
jgi:hypothetical protein